MERKRSHGFGTKAQPAGLVETVFAVMGNVDQGNDMLHPGAFVKTFVERGRKVKVLDHHNTDSIMRAIGKVVALKELSRSELPPELLQEHPEATGGAWAQIQFLMDTPEGNGAFTRLREGAVDEWSFGYDALDVDYSKAVVNGAEQTVRNLRTVKLYEISPVLWGMNPATETLSAKAESKIEPGSGESESDWMERCVPAMVDEGRSQEQAVAMCLRIYGGKAGRDEEEDGQKAVTRTEGDGEHPAGHYLVVEDPESPSSWHLRVRNVDGELDHRLMGAAWAALHGGYRGNVYEGPGKREAIAKLRGLYEDEGMPRPDEGEGKRERPKTANVADYFESSIHANFTMLADDWFGAGLLTREERIGLSSLIGDALDVFHAGLQGEAFAGLRMRRPGDEAKAGRVLAARNASRLKAAVDSLIEILRDAGLYGDDEAEEPPEERAGLPTQAETKAGPALPPTSDVLRTIDVKLLELETMEVDDGLEGQAG